MQGPTAEDHAMGPAAASGLTAKGWAWLCSVYSGYPWAVLGHGFGFGPKETNQHKHSKAYLPCEISHDCTGVMEERNISGKSLLEKQ